MIGFEPINMRTIKRKHYFMLIICFVVLVGATILLTTQTNQSHIASAQELSVIEMPKEELNPLKITAKLTPREAIDAIESKLNEQGTSVLAELYKMRDYYLNDINSSERSAIVNTINEAIAYFEKGAFILPEKGETDETDTV